MLSFWVHVRPGRDTSFPDDQGGEGNGDGQPPRSPGERQRHHHGKLLLVKWVRLSMSSALYTWRGGVAKVA
jgi:hypothetical protein